MYLLRLSLRPWRVALYSQLLMALGLSFLLFVTGLIGWMERSIDPILAKVSGEQVLTAYLGPEISQSEAESMKDEIRIQLGAQATRIELIDRKGFLERLDSKYPQLRAELENLGGELETVVPRYISMTGFFEKDAATRLSTLTGIESVDSSAEKARSIIGAFVSVQWLIRFLGLGMLIVLLVLFLQSARSNAQSYGDSLAVLRSWGAGEWLLRVPGALSGMILGGLAGVFAAGAWLFLPGYLVGELRLLAPSFDGIADPPLWIAPALLAAGLLGGAAFGVLTRAPRKLIQVLKA